MSAEPIADIVTENMDQPIVEEAAAVSGGIIADGIYRLTNKYVKENYSSYGTFYLRGENNTVELSSYYYGSLADNLYSYWYFEHKGNNEYMIYSMADHSKALSMSNGDAVLSPVASAFRWIVQSDNYGGYQLASAYSPFNDLLSVITTPTLHQAPAATLYYYYTTDVQVGTIADMLFDSWELTAANISGLYFQNNSNNKLHDTFGKTYYTSGSTVTLSSMGYSLKAISPTNGLITPAPVTWTSSNPSVATVAANGNVTLISCGETTITASGRVDGALMSASYNLTIYFDAALLALPREDNGDRSSYFPNIVQDLNSIGYTHCYNNHSVVANGVTEADMLRFMQYSKITLIRTHGLPTSITATDGVLEKNELGNGLLNYSDLIVYGACLTASGGEFADNLARATYLAGARTVIGFEVSIDYRFCNEWCELFFESLALYYDDSTMNYSDMCRAIDLEVGGYDFTEEAIDDYLVHVVCGEKSFL